MNATTANGRASLDEHRPAERLDERHRGDRPHEHARVEEEAHDAVHPAEQFSGDALLQRRLPAGLIERRRGGADEEQRRAPERGHRPARRRRAGSPRARKPSAMPRAPMVRGVQRSRTRLPATPPAPTARVEPADVGRVTEALRSGDDQHRLQRRDRGGTTEERGRESPKHRVARHDTDGAFAMLAPAATRSDGRPNPEREHQHHRRRQSSRHRRRRAPRAG